jgi:HEPN domain-containing protein
MQNTEQAKAFVAMAREDMIAAQCSSLAYSICFHAQQAAEKYLKAVLAYQGIAIPKTHNISKLIELCAIIDESFGALSSDADQLNLFAVEMRYRASKEEAEKRCPEAWRATCGIYEAVKRHLPKELMSWEAGG